MVENPNQLLSETTEGPQGKFYVSTIVTIAGGGVDYTRPDSPFSLSAYFDSTPWPFETIVFGQHRSKGVYHMAHIDKRAALVEHERIVAEILGGTLELGCGVEGLFGNPTLTPAEWAARGVHEA